MDDYPACRSHTLKPRDSNVPDSALMILVDPEKPGFIPPGFLRLSGRSIPEKTGGFEKKRTVLTETIQTDPQRLDPALPTRLREFHDRLPLVGNPPNAVLALPDDRVLYLVALLRDTPQPVPSISSEEWKKFLGLL